MEFKEELSRISDQERISYEVKLSMYQQAVVPIIDVINQQILTPDKLKEFESKRMEVHAHLAMFAPISVIQAYSRLIDYVLDSMEKPEIYSFSTFRNYAFECLSEIRKDIGIHSDSVTYDGHR